MKEIEFKYKGSIEFEENGFLYFCTNKPRQVIKFNKELKSETVHTEDIGLYRLINCHNGKMIATFETSKLALMNTKCDVHKELEGYSVVGKPIDNKILIDSFKNQKSYLLDISSFDVLWELNGKVSSLFVETDNVIIHCPFDFQFMGPVENKLIQVDRIDGKIKSEKVFDDIIIKKLFLLDDNNILLIDKNSCAYTYSFTSDLLQDITNEFGLNSFKGIQNLKVHNSRFISLSNHSFSELDLNKRTFQYYTYKRDQKKYSIGETGSDYNEEDVWVQQYIPLGNYLLFTGHYFGWPNREQIVGVFSITEKQIIKMISIVLPGNAFFGKIGFLHANEKHFFCKDSNGDYHCFEHGLEISV